MAYVVYILASQKRGTLYVGVTNNLSQRLEQHRHGRISSFTKRYKVFRLVYAEEYAVVTEAIQREKTIKEWRRQWKIELIESINPDWKELS
ncbi:MAG: GIY-YIG nuclease family protein [Alphaproteobacteria bacterium]|nr:GIY-YIG nuclease family protein [Alphaproteobacteria bacterium]NDC55778.1 GIY-YIG nuclease family protein [Alphaproteobacteria bacterium]NDG04950.1 GIY-YIG nuclease family protein [Alphaproteobacteria bacterium]